MDKIITVLGYKKFITEMSYAPDCLRRIKVLINDNAILLDILGNPEGTKLLI